MKNLYHLSAEKLNTMKIVDWGYTEQLEPISFDHYDQWINANLFGPLKYLADQRKDKRKSLKNVCPACESAIVFLFDYREAKKLIDSKKRQYKIASYSIGFDDQDYHFWIKDKLELIANNLKNQISNLEYQISLDVHPVLERDLAYRAGLGWFGKNSMLINKEFGSYQLIGSLLLNQKLSLKSQALETDHCGTCTRCIEACPTEAINGEARTLDSQKCISTFTIELFKDEKPPKGYPTYSGEIFGCDICQEVCPWNSKPLVKAETLQQSQLLNYFDRSLDKIDSELNELSNKQFKNKFKSTSFERLGKKGMLKNLKYYK